MSWIKHQRTDIIMLQETFLTCDLENVIKMECNYHCYFNHGIGFPGQFHGFVIYFHMRSIQFRQIRLFIEIPSFKFVFSHSN